MVLKLLHASAVHDRSALHRFLTRTRLLASIAHDYLPESIEAGFVETTPFVSYDLIEGAHRLTARVLGDYVRAELDNDTNLPRITPGRYGVGMDYDSKTWLGSVEALRASRQDNEGPLEDETAGYTDLTAFVGYRLAGYDDTETMVYLRGDNLLDDEIVRSTSFLRVAQPGRSVIAGVNVKF